MAQLGLLAEDLDGVQGLLAAGDIQMLGGCAGGGDDSIIAAILDHLRSGLRVQTDIYPQLLTLTDLPVLKPLDAPFSIDIVRVNGLTAQNAGLFKQRDLMAPLGADHGGTHACGAAANDGHLFTALAGPEHIVKDVFEAEDGVYGTDGAVAAVAAEAGGDVIRALLDDLLEVIRVAVIGTSHEYHITLALFNGPLNDIGILKTAGGADDGVDACILQSLGVLEGRGILLRENIGAGVLAVASGGSDMVDVYIFIPQLQHFNPLGVKGRSYLHGDQKIGAAQGTDSGEQLRGGTAAVFQRAAILIRPGVGCAHIADGGDLYHIEAKATVFQCIVGDILDPVLNFSSSSHTFFTAAAGSAHAAHAPGGHAGTPLGADPMVLRTVSAHAGRWAAGAEGAEAAAGLWLREAQALRHAPMALHET